MLATDQKLSSGRVWFVLMAAGLSKDIRCRCILLTILFLLANHQIRHIKWAVSLVIAYGYLNLPLVCVGMYGLTYSLYHPRGGVKWRQEF